MSYSSRRASAASRLASLSVLVLLASGCSSLAGGNGAAGSPSPTPSDSQTTSATPTPTTPAVELNSNITAGSTVRVDTTVTAWANGGRLSAVILKPDGTYKENPGEVPGSVGRNQATWQASRLLDPGRKYVLTITGANSDGVETTNTLRFATKDLSRDEEVYPNSIPGDGSTVGVAMPVVMTFDLSVENKAAFERAMKVTSVPAQPGSWRWISDREAHWRPKVYWKPGTKVSLEAKLNGIPAGNGRFGQMDRTAKFTVGRSVLGKIDLSAHRMQVVIDGKVVNDLPVTGGKPGFVTRSGTKVIMEKLWTTRMVANTDKDDPEYYDLADVKYAMRVTWSGEFIHAAPWSAGSQGYANVSHGCVGLTTERAAWLFNEFKVGDPVVVTGTGRGLDEGNGWTDWNMSFESFAKGSALN